MVNICPVVVRLEQKPFYLTISFYVYKVQELGLESTCRTDSSTYKYIWKVMALPFLPEADIPPMFQSPRDTPTTVTLQELVK